MMNKDFISAVEARNDQKTFEEMFNWVIETGIPQIQYNIERT